ncbi:unnamed protein product [Closterium sp. Yama58-4]|nr:unnamed protein product [Closterium sp. Yama58-4]
MARSPSSCYILGRRPCSLLSHGICPPFPSPSLSPLPPNLSSFPSPSLSPLPPNFPSLPVALAAVALALSSPTRSALPSRRPRSLLSHPISPPFPSPSLSLLSTQSPLPSRRLARSLLSHPISPPFPSPSLSPLPRDLPSLPVALALSSPTRSPLPSRHPRSLLSHAICPHRVNFRMTNRWTLGDGKPPPAQSLWTTYLIFRVSVACDGVPELREVTFAYPSLSDVSALVSLLCLSLLRPSALPLSPAPQTARFRSPLPFVSASRVPGSHSHPSHSLPSFFSPSPAGLRDAGGGSRQATVGVAEAGRGDRAGDSAESAGVAAGRGDVGVGRRERAAACAQCVHGRAQEGGSLWRSLAVVLIAGSIKFGVSCWCQAPSDPSGRTSLN